MENDQAAQDISKAERDGLYKIIMGRRDVRSQFLAKPIEDDKLVRILQAAHHAPSVGFMQPWNFMVIRSRQRRQEVLSLFEKANKEARDLFEGKKGDLYSRLKLQGILESPLNICVTCDRDRGGQVVLGRTHNRDTDLYSTVCAIQNLWLAARAEGIGVGWVSIFNDSELKQTLLIPEEIVPVAYLCLGYVSGFGDQPELEQKGWAKRLSLGDLVMFDQWQGENEDDPLVAELQKTVSGQDGQG